MDFFAARMRQLQSQLPAMRSVARATYLRRSRSVQLVRKLAAGLRDVIRASMILPERSSKQQQQELSQKVLAGQAVSKVCHRRRWWTNEMRRLTVCSADPTAPHQSWTSAVTPTHRCVGRELVRGAAPGRRLCAATGSMVVARQRGGGGYCV